MNLVTNDRETLKCIAQNVKAKPGVILEGDVCELEFPETL